MTTNDFVRSREIFDQLRGLSPDERERALVEACRGDRGLMDDVASLLASHDDPGNIGLTGAASGWAQEFLEPGTADDLPDAIGPYRVVALLGLGGMGRVYRVEQIEPIRRELALKLIPGGRHHPEFLRRFRFEKQSLARMNHSGIANVIDAGEDEFGDPYFVMELVRGTGLLDYCESRGLGWDARLGLFLQICDAIQHAHQKGIVHRDLKPSNILVGEDTGEPIVKVIDFGVAKALEPDSEDPRTSTHFRQVLGTLEFMSPEQAGGRSADIDTRSDVYALGVILYRLATGRLPHDLGGLTLGAALRSIAESDPVEVPGLDADLRAVVGKALEKSPHDRYASVTALAEDLERMRSGYPVLARRASSTYQLRKLYQRHRGRFVLATVALGVLFGFAVVMTGMYQKQRELAESAQVAAQRAEQSNQFFRRMLGSVERGRFGHDASVREVLDRASRELESVSDYDDRLRADALTTLGEAYRSVGQLDAAVKHFEKADKVWAAVPDAPSAEIVQTRTGLSKTLMDQMEPGRALEVMQGTVELARSALDPDDPVYRECLSAYSAPLRAAHRLEEAERVVREILAVETRDGSPPSFRGLNYLCLILQEQGKYAEAAREGRALVAVDAPGPRPVGLINLAAWLKSNGELAEAESLSTLALGAIEDDWAVGDPRRAGLWNVHGQILLARGSWAAADSLFRRALDLSPYPSARLNLSLARIYALDLDGAERVLEPLIRAEDGGGLAILSRLGWIEWGRGNLEAARSLFEQAVLQAEEEYVSPHPETGLALHALAGCLLDLDQPEEAEVIARQAVEEIEGRLRSEHSFTRLAVHTLATCQAALGSSAWADSVVETGLAEVLRSESLHPLARAQRRNQALRILESRGLSMPTTPGFAWMDTLGVRS